jgi:hypothetical protein
MIQSIHDRPLNCLVLDCIEMKQDAIRALALCVLAFPALSRSASAQMLYGAESGANSPLYIVQPTTGQVAAIGNIGFGVSALAVHPRTGILYGVTAQAPANIFTRSLIRIDRVTGAGTLIGPIGLGDGGVADIAFRADGVLFGWSENTDDLITIDINTGAGTVVGNAASVRAAAASPSTAAARSIWPATTRAAHCGRSIPPPVSRPSSRRSTARPLRPNRSPR